MTTSPRVLIVDDDDEIRLILARFVEADSRFELAGQASDGRQAVEIATATAPDAIILDIRMPVMDGIEALAHLNAVCPDAVVVMFTHDGHRGDEALRLGAHAAYGKHLPVRDLLDELHLHVGEPRTAR